MLSNVYLESNLHLSLHQGVILMAENTPADITALDNLGIVCRKHTSVSKRK